MTQESLDLSYRKMSEKQKRSWVSLKQSSMKTCAETLKISFCFVLNAVLWRKNCILIADTILCVRWFFCFSYCIGELIHFTLVFI